VLTAADGAAEVGDLIQLKSEHGCWNQKWWMMTSNQSYQLVMV